MFSQSPVDILAPKVRWSHSLRYRHPETHTHTLRNTHTHTHSYTGTPISTHKHIHTPTTSLVYLGFCNDIPEIFTNDLYE